MNILINDITQFSNLSSNLKSPNLAPNTISLNTGILITFDKEYEINCIGIGNSSGIWFSIIDNNTGISAGVEYKGSGLYMFDKTMKTNNIVLITSSNTVGRIAMGKAVRIPTAVSKQVGFNSTNNPRTTLSGQIIEGRGGYNFKTLNLDSRYKITEEIMNEFIEARPFIGMGYPFFIDLSDEAYKLPFDKLYAIDRNQQSLSFSSGVRNFLYSKRWQFEERF